MWRWLLAVAVPTMVEAEARGSFEYRYPPAIRAQPGLRAWLDADAARVRQAYRRDLASERREAATDETLMPLLQVSVTWQVVTETPRLISLSTNKYTVFGSQRGWDELGALVWDKAAGRALRPVDVFRSRAALRAAILRPFCEALDRDRFARRRGAAGESLSECVDPTESTVILGSSDRRHIDRIGVQFDIRSMAAMIGGGKVEVTIPVTAAVLAAVRPTYRDTFAIER